MARWKARDEFLLVVIELLFSERVHVCYLLSPVRLSVCRLSVCLSSVGNARAPYSGG